jgi:hypothetical protein
VAIELDDIEQAGDVSAWVVGAGYRLFGMVPGGASLEDVFLRLVGRGEEG